MDQFSEYEARFATGRARFAAFLPAAEIPPLPEALSRLVREMGRLDPDTTRLEAIMAEQPEFSACVMRAVETSAFGIWRPIRSIRHAITLLGLLQVRSLAFSYVMIRHMPRPRHPHYDPEAFWTDSLLRALLARALAWTTERLDHEEVYTAALLGDVALPVLLAHRPAEYEPVLAAWRQEGGSLAELEESLLGWTHGQATDAILRHWGFPVEFARLAGAHHLPIATIHALGLAGTAALPVAVACQLPSILCAAPARCRTLVAAAQQELGLVPASWQRMLPEIQEQFLSISREFEIAGDRAGVTLDALASALADGGPGGGTPTRG